MPKATARFPAEVWDGSSATRLNDDGNVAFVARPPDGHDYNQIVAETIATQAYVKTIDSVVLVPSVDYSVPAADEEIGGAKTYIAPVDHIAGSTVSATISHVSLTSGLATFTTIAPHGFSLGWSVRVSGLTSKTGGSITFACNGVQLIASIPTATTFTAMIPEADIASTADTGSAVAGPDSWQYHDSADDRVLIHNPLVTRHDSRVQHNQPLVVQVPTGEAITFRLAEIYPGFTWPYSKASVFGERGNFASGFEMILSQNRDINGNHLGIASGNQATNPSDAEPSFLDVATDINGSCIKLQASDGSGSVGVTNATCIAFYNQDEPDNRFPGTPYAPATGAKQLAIWGNGRHDWGFDLHNNPVANRTASWYRHENTGNLTVEGPPSGPATTFDLETNGAVGTGYSEIVLGRGPDRSPYFQMRTVSHATAPITTLSISATSGLMDAITLTSFFNGSVYETKAKITNLDVSAGIDLVNASNAVKTSFDALGNVATQGNVIANIERVPIRIGWTGNAGEDPYAGIWFVATPSLSNFAFLTAGTTNIVNAPSGGNLSLRVGNSQAANFSGSGIQLGIGSTGTLFQKVISATATLDFGSTAAQASSDLTITLTGAKVGNTLEQVGLPSSPAANTRYTAWVSAPDTVTVRFENNSAISVDPVIGLYRVTARVF